MVCNNFIFILRTSIKYFRYLCFVSMLYVMLINSEYKMLDLINNED